jgi:hypothetical protein
VERLSLDQKLEARLTPTQPFVLRIRLYYADNLHRAGCLKRKLAQ